MIQDGAVDDITDTVMINPLKEYKYFKTKTRYDFTFRMTLDREPFYVRVSLKNHEDREIKAWCGSKSSK